MSRFVALVCICALADAHSQLNALYDDLERQYADLVEAATVGEICAGRSSAVIERQRALASALAAATPRTGPRVLLFAVAANSLQDVRRFNEAGASREGDNGSLLHVAARLADAPVLEYLTSIGFGVEELGGAGGPALMVAVTSQRLDNAAWLIEHGANVNATDTAGGLVVRYALVCKDQTVIDFLLEAGAVPDARTIEIAQRLGMRVSGRP
jgi:hypothetical protein